MLLFLRLSSQSSPFRTVCSSFSDSLDSRRFRMFRSSFSFFERVAALSQTSHSSVSPTFPVCLVPFGAALFFVRFSSPFLSGSLLFLGFSSAFRTVRCSFAGSSFLAVRSFSQIRQSLSKGSLLFLRVSIVSFERFALFLRFSSHSSLFPSVAFFLRFCCHCRMVRSCL